MFMPIIKDLLRSKNRKPITVSSAASIFDALKIMAESNIGCLIVLEGDSYVGIFTERDYARKIVLEGRSSDTTTVNEIMISDIPMLNINDPIECFHRGGHNFTQPIKVKRLVICRDKSRQSQRC